MTNNSLQLSTETLSIPRVNYLHDALKQPEIATGTLEIVRHERLDRDGLVDFFKNEIVGKQILVGEITLHPPGSLQINRLVEPVPQFNEQLVVEESSDSLCVRNCEATGVIKMSMAGVDLVNLQLKADSQSDTGKMEVWPNLFFVNGAEVLVVKDENSTTYFIENWRMPTIQTPNKIHYHALTIANTAE